MEWIEPWFLGLYTPHGPKASKGHDHCIAVDCFPSENNATPYSTICLSLLRRGGACVCLYTSKCNCTISKSASNSNFLAVTSDLYCRRWFLTCVVSLNTVLNKVPSSIYLSLLFLCKFLTLVFFPIAILSHFGNIKSPKQNAAHIFQSFPFRIHSTQGTCMQLEPIRSCSQRMDEVERKPQSVASSRVVCRTGNSNISIFAWKQWGKSWFLWPLFVRISQMTYDGDWSDQAPIYMILNRCWWIYLRVKRDGRWWMGFDLPWILIRVSACVSFMDPLRYEYEGLLPICMTFNKLISLSLSFSLHRFDHGINSMLRTRQGIALLWHSLRSYCIRRHVGHWWDSQKILKEDVLGTSSWGGVLLIRDQRSTEVGRQ